MIIFLLILAVDVWLLIKKEISKLFFILSTLGIMLGIFALQMLSGLYQYIFIAIAIVIIIVSMSKPVLKLIKFILNK